MKPRRPLDVAPVVAALMVFTIAISWSWGYWVGDSDARVYRDQIAVEREVLRQQAHALCDGPAWVDVADDRRILCATGSMRLHQWGKK